MGKPARQIIHDRRRPFARGGVVESVVQRFRLLLLQQAGDKRLEVDREVEAIRRLEPRHITEYLGLVFRGNALDVGAEFVLDEPDKIRQSGVSLHSLEQILQRTAAGYLAALRCEFGVPSELVEQHQQASEGFPVTAVLAYNHVHDVARRFSSERLDRHSFGFEKAMHRLVNKLVLRFEPFHHAFHRIRVARRQESALHLGVRHSDEACRLGEPGAQRFDRFDVASGFLQSPDHLPRKFRSQIEVLHPVQRHDQTGLPGRIHCRPHVRRDCLIRGTQARQHTLGCFA